MLSLAYDEIQKVTHAEILDNVSSRLSRALHLSKHLLDHYERLASRCILKVSTIKVAETSEVVNSGYPYHATY